MLSPLPQHVQVLAKIPGSLKAEIPIAAIHESVAVQNLVLKLCLVFLDLFDLVSLVDGLLGALEPCWSENFPVGTCRT